MGTTPKEITLSFGDSLNHEAKGDGVLDVTISGGEIIRCEVYVECLNDLVPMETSRLTKRQIEKIMNVYWQALADNEETAEDRAESHDYFREEGGLQ